MINYGDKSNHGATFFNKGSDLNFPIPAAELRGIKPKEIKK